VTTSISSISGANDNAECAAGNWFNITQGTYSGIIPAGGSVTDTTTSMLKAAPTKTPARTPH
jgi:hypothetical protein